jgi:excisionase family DNA binding protein
MTVHTAARVLGISEDAVRMRVKRGTLDAEREGGRLYVMLEAEPTNDPTGRTEMIEELRDRLRYIEGQLEQEREARTEERRRHDTLMAQLMQRIPELEAPSNSPDATGAPESATHDAERVDVPDRGTAPQEGTQPRPWWRRVFGG